MVKCFVNWSKNGQNMAKTPLFCSKYGTFWGNFAYMGTSRGFLRENGDNFYKYGDNRVNLDVNHVNFYQNVNKSSKYHHFWPSKCIYGGNWAVLDVNSIKFTHNHQNIIKYHPKSLIITPNHTKIPVLCSLLATSPQIWGNRCHFGRKCVKTVTKWGYFDDFVQ